LPPVTLGTQHKYRNAGQDIYKEKVISTYEIHKFVFKGSPLNETNLFYAVFKVHRSKGDSSYHILPVCNLRRKSLRWYGKDLQSLLCWLSKALWVSVSGIQFIYSQIIVNWAYCTVRLPVYLANLLVVRPSVRPFVTQYKLPDSLLDCHIIRFGVSAGEDIKHAWFAWIEPQWPSQITCLGGALSIFLGRCVWYKLSNIATHFRLG